jgi:AcrR family transcriptional regulator
MGEAVGELGYAQTPVAEVIDRAGVSRKAFYEHFANREACFLEASESIVTRTIELLNDSFESAQSELQGVEAAIAAVFEQAFANPPAARTILVELGALGKGGILMREQLFTASERLFKDFIGPPPGRTLPNPLLRATLGGLSTILYGRLCDRHSDISPTLVAELVLWLASYQAPPSAVVNPTVRSSRLASKGGRAPGTLGRRAGMRRENSPDKPQSPRRRQAIPYGDQRESILDAVATLSAAGGCAGITVRTLRTEAGASKEVFYEHFAGVEDAFLVAYELGHGRGMEAIRAASREAPDWATSVRAGTAALLDFLACEPAFAYLALVDAHVVTARTAARARHGLREYAELFSSGLKGASAPATPLAVEATVGALAELCISYSLKGRSAQLPSLVAPATYVALAPFIGIETAAQVATGT